MGRRFFIFLWLLLGAPGAPAGEVVVAVAANFSEPMRAIAADFERAGGHRVAAVVGSTGKLATQIEQGAPFDVFVAADQATPLMLLRHGFAVAGTTVTYAKGRLVCWSLKPGVDVRDGRILRVEPRARLAIAEPRLAPYGAAAEQVLRKLGVWDRMQPRLVRGGNIGQAWQFVASGNADLGLLAKSQVYRDGQWQPGSVWLVPADWHAPLRQDAVLLRRAAGSGAARELLAYLSGPAAQAVIRRHGYE
jgi:molybdate transport system substrate-binding protein